MVDPGFHGLARLARLLRRRFGPGGRRTFVMLEAEVTWPPRIRLDDQETQRIPALQRR